jgi:SAM-dependent methyltransferase
VKRSAQEMYKQRIVDSYLQREPEFLRRMDDAEKRGPGTLTYDKDFIYPDYAKVDIHLQPRGYVGHPLAGMFYDYGTSIFYGGSNEEDGLHARVARDTPIPQDGKVLRILELGCGIGQLACELKRLYPHAEVHATDISAPMVRYGHWRATEQKAEVHFAQMPSEDMDFADKSFDLIVSHILFHEIPVPVIDKTLAEIHRMLRPGGTYVMWDFASTAPGAAPDRGLIGLMDTADNGEPYASSFVSCDIEGKLEKQGFSLRSRVPKGVAMGSRVCDKPL